ncbi:AAA family ATPase [Streptomyces sp. NPDC059740]|uniref:AAA family ATPase n=1 Tax=Streptomyces sp. NPDC059740 TaxID=3346926 RepID=UPI0036570F50
MSKPFAVGLIGITGSGKTTLATALAARGMVRLSVDEEVHRLHGRYGIDYPEHEYGERERPVVEAVLAELVDHLRAGRDLVLDHGLWLRRERDDLRRTVERAGGRLLLVYLPVEMPELLARLERRNRRDDANALTVTPSALDDFFDRFEPPEPDEPVLIYAGDPEAVWDEFARDTSPEGGAPR